MKNIQRYISIALEVIVAVCATIGVCLTAMNDKSAFLFFTVQSNTWIGAISLVAAIYGIRNLVKGQSGMPHLVWMLKYVFTVSITITGIVYCAVLAPTMPGAFKAASSVLTHVVVPVAAIADLFVGEKGRIAYKDFLYALIPLLYYLGFASIGYVQNWDFGEGRNYPYFFMNWGSPAGAFGFADGINFMGTFYWIIALLIFVSALSLFYIALLRKALKGKNVTPVLIFAAALALGACSGNRDAENAKKEATVERLKAYTEAISHDSCQGRKPFSEGADKAVKYIAAQMEEIGLIPIDGDSYFQQVSINSSRSRCNGPMILKTPKGRMVLQPQEDFVAFSARNEEKIRIKDAELVFAGYGIVAPEYGKNDFAGIENPGDKVAVVIVNDPGLGSDDKEYFNGDDMTYYGRWMYKLEEAARQGLKGVLIIHQDRGAGYGWSVVRASNQARMYVDSDGEEYHCPLNGWIQFDVARRLLADNGYDIDKLIEKSKSPDFRPFSLNSTVTVEMELTFDRQQTPNVAGYIPGSGNTDESIVYIAHWDHLGYGAPIEGDSIINGATDNAVGVAWLLEIARCFNSLKEKPRRNIVLISPTCEESGFLGTKYYVENPLFPIEKTVAVINLDVFPLWGENNDVTITGYGHSDLDDLVAELAEKYDRYVIPDPDAYNGMFYRSDHFPFVQKGIPAMFAKGWNDNRIHGKEWSKENIARYWAETYHKPTDQVHPDTDDYSGLLQEVHLFFDLGYELAQGTTYPQWNPKSEFANILKR